MIPPPVVLVCCQIVWLVIQAKPRRRDADDRREARELDETDEAEEN